MNNTSRFALLTLTATLGFGGVTAISMMPAKADTLENVATTNQAPEHTANVDITQFEQYIDIQNNKYVLNVPGAVTMSVETQLELQAMINAMNDTIVQSDLHIVDPDNESPMEKFQRAGWRYWGNGVYTKGNKVKVDWSKAWHAVGNISYGTWAGSLGSFGQQVRPSRPVFPYPTY